MLAPTSGVLRAPPPRRHTPLLCVCLLSLASSVLAAKAPGSAPRVFPLAKPPTSARVESFLTAHRTEWTRTDNTFWLDPDHTSRVSGDSGRLCRGRWHTSQATIAVEMACVTYDDKGRPRGKPQRTAFEVGVLLVGPDILVAREEDGTRLVVVCDPGAAACHQVDDAVLVEIIRGAPEGALHRAVTHSLLQHAAAHAQVLLFEGPPAKTPRATTEVFAASQPDQATPLLDALTPVTGPLTVQPWPGVWSYDVVVVTGAGRTAAAP